MVDHFTFRKIMNARISTRKERTDEDEINLWATTIVTPLQMD